MNYAGSFRDHFLVANEFPSNETSGTFELFPRTRPSPVVAGEFSTLYGFILYEFDYDLHDQAAQLTGSKQLLDAILSLGLSQSFENDDALRGLLLGTEGVPDTVSARAVFDAEAVRLQAGLWERPADLEAILAGRFEVFQTRLFECLDAISLAGQPEIPHMVRQTLSLLEILRSSHRNGVTPSAVFGMNECAMTPSLLEVSLFGEPYIHYNLKSTDYFNGWSVDGQILHSGESAQIELGGIAPSAFLTATVAEAP